MTDLKAITELIEETAKHCGVDGNLALAIASVESGFDPHACRYEAKWQYVILPEIYAASNGITADTEIVLQKMSWGCLQVMGSVARELGYHGALNGLTDPSLGILYGCRKLETLSKRYLDESDLISAYNAGTPDKSTGHYRNQVYVNSVRSKLAVLRKIQ